MRKLRVTPAGCVAMVALVLAAGGGAYAATSTTGAKSITACEHHHGGGLYVAKHCSKGDRKLQWNVTGPAGPAGTQGPQGPQGGTGSTGATGTFALTLASGKSLTGTYGFTGSATTSGQLVGDTQSFIVPLAAAPNPNDVLLGEKATTNCPGSAAEPKAAPGQLCIYEAQRTNLQLVGWENPLNGETGGKVPAFGFEMSATSKASGAYEDFGSWAVTAP